MVDLTVFLQEYAEAGYVARVPALTLSLHLFLAAEVELHRTDGFVHGRVEIIVEVGVATGVPRPSPAVLLSEGFELVNFAAGHTYQVRVLQAKMTHVWERLSHVAAATATLVITWLEHEVVNDQLFMAFEKVAQADAGVVWALESVGLVYFDHGKVTTLCGESIVGSCKLLFFLEQSFSSGEPLITADNLVVVRRSVERTSSIDTCFACHYQEC